MWIDFIFLFLQDLTEIRSADRRSTMLDFVLDSMEGEPFYNELKEIEHTAALSFDELAGAMYKLNKGYTECESELQHIESGECPGDGTLLVAFLARVKDKLEEQKKILADARETFKNCANAFGEESKNAKDLPRFFGLIAGFIQCCKQHEKEAQEAKKEKHHAPIRSPIPKIALPGMRAVNPLMPPPPPPKRR